MQRLRRCRKEWCLIVTRTTTEAVEGFELGLVRTLYAKVELEERLRVPIVHHLRAERALDLSLRITVLPQRLERVDRSQTGRGTSRGCRRRRDSAVPGCDGRVTT